MSRLASFLGSWYLPVGVLLAMGLGLQFPVPGAWLDQTSMQTISIIILFLQTGVELDTGDHVLESLKQSWLVALCSVCSILFITPCAVFLFPLVGLGPVMALGLTLFAVSPTTVSTGAILVSQGHGDVPLSIVLTILTNVLSIFTIPILLPTLLGDSVGTIELDQGNVLLQLGYMVLVPLLFGNRVLRPVQSIREWVTVNPATLKFVGNTLLIILPWMKVSSAAMEFGLVSQLQLITVSAAAVALHCSYLIFHHISSICFGVSDPVRKAVTIMCSQKTVTVGFALIAILPEDTLGTNNGILAIPIICGNLVQILLDSVVVTYWGNNMKAAHAVASTLEELDLASKESTSVV